ncbi:acyltransferase domain-containing protein [Streptomyces sp. NPDC049687]|uniref:acyltransferase domain-containing protein n=1 Tax=Streptomyces sp. NPDC049687 TaxID=3365596 RepID=UPI0037A19E8D
MPPDADEPAEAFLDLGVPHQDIDEAVRLRRRFAGDAETLRALEEAVGKLVDGMGGIRCGTDFPELLGGAGPRARYFPL